ncbi:hypothetical protein Ava_0858 [Trichormus variabilis ATCC 29413]|uniref:Uncharacterized protein n=2 Tax=Anabaena variabilis TaxID=264691 RepID=Q3MEV4_TRIV2|nr:MULTISPECIES: hypothetical protein [Nostocaceae]ABA20482.1 hypothetical protein Ava_0858 [Trichormus variabilis ATCC 29413]MBC1216166.1 hypothetical protein [Trichormus variabilis ARAD]MBC1255529.1 hypothetical protein [Trichormus variabilis V5]MBC1268992.1 hypothetical protein [Trichormus variabilis FSR]MBC1304599.1 hypothetical protein [Trichormus variabilis N2B]
MKLNQILKLAIIPFLTVFSVLGTSSLALADYLSSQGTGGKYRYELWSSNDNKSYYLKIWLRDSSYDSSPYTTTRAFTSTRDALIHFDCNYAEKNLPEC